VSSKQLENKCGMMEGWNVGMMEKIGDSKKQVEE